MTKLSKHTVAKATKHLQRKGVVFYKNLRIMNISSAKNNCSLGNRSWGRIDFLKKNGYIVSTLKLKK